MNFQLLSIYGDAAPYALSHFFDRQRDKNTRQVDVKEEQTDVRVLIIYFSLSGQSRGLVNLFASGLKEEGVQVVV
ncbi:MAG: hypothetical protein V2I35_05695, partial [Desulfocapsaceae bacterium]|nr:hypothetical protein [Desulfocapsaceae bacterium]